VHLHGVAGARKRREVGRHDRLTDGDGMGDACDSKPLDPALQ